MKSRRILHRHTVLVGAVLLALLAYFWSRGGRDVARIDEPTWSASPELRAALARAGELDPGGPERHRISGRVVDVAGEPQADVFVGALGPETIEFTWSDAAGGFALANLEPGPIEIVLVTGRLPHGRLTITVPASGPLDLPLPVPLGPVPLLPEIHRAPLAGRVETSFSESADGYTVAFLPRPSPASPTSTATWSAALEGRVPRRAHCDASGAFALPDLATGAYRLIVLPPWAAGGTWPELLERSFEHAQDSGVIVLRSQAGRITGTLRETRGDPIVGARVEVHDSEAPERIWPPALSGPDGSFTVRHLPEGTYRVSVATGEARAEETVRVSALRATEVTFGELVLLGG